MGSTRFSYGRLVAVAAFVSCSQVPATTTSSPSLSPVSDTVDARRLFEENIDAINKRDRARYLATYLPSTMPARNGPGGLELGYDNWSPRRASTWPDTLIARTLRVLPI